MLQQTYLEQIKPKLLKELSLNNPMAVPGLKKVVINVGLGNFRDNKEAQEQIVKDLAMISGQKPSLRPARKSIASFGTRKGQIIGAAVTLRGKRMYSFLDKLFNIVLPRLRDFRGVSKKSFDLSGNFTLGFSEHTVFPEIDLGKVNRIFGLEVVIVTDTREREKSERLLREMGMPFEKS